MRALSLGPTFIPGQRFVQTAGVDHTPTQTVTISRVDRDPFGFPVVIFRGHDGRCLSIYGSQVEAALAVGALAPIGTDLVRSA